jgi:hypothetical protein
VTISLGVCDYFIRCVLSVLLGVVCYGCFNFICFIICVCVCVFVIHFLCSVCVLICIVL